MKYPDIFNSDISRVGLAESRAYNIEAAILMAGMVKTSFGPRGMEKMYVDIIGEETITKHGGAFLRKIDVDHPAAKAVADAVNTVDTHVGDGTITSALLIRALLIRAQKLMIQKIPVSMVIRGFEMALQQALVILEQIAVKPDSQHDYDVVSTSLFGTAMYNSLADSKKLPNLIIDAVKCVTDGTGHVDTDLIKIEEKMGSSADIQLIRGTVIDKPLDSSQMPHTLNNVRVLLLNDPLETTRTKTESSIEITSPYNMMTFAQQQDSDILDVVQKVIDSGAGLVISRKGISELAQEQLARQGIVSIRRAKYNDIWWLEKSTGAKTCSSVYDILSDELGFASAVYQKTVGDDHMVFVESDVPSSVTLLLRATSKRYLDEFHRTTLNAVRSLQNFVEEPRIVYGGGSCEIILAKKIRSWSYGIEGREQLAAEAFAGVLEEIPCTLAINAGMDALDTITALRAKSAAEPDKWWGIDTMSHSVKHIRNIVDTCAVKRQALKTAVEAANQILRVDDVFMKDIMDNTHSHIDGKVHTHKDPGRNHNYWEQEGIEQRQMHHYY